MNSPYFGFEITWTAFELDPVSSLNKGWLRTFVMEFWYLIQYVLLGITEGAGLVYHLLSSIY